MFENYFVQLFILLVTLLFCVLLLFIISCSLKKYVGAFSFLVFNRKFFQKIFFHIEKMNVIVEKKIAIVFRKIEID